MIDLIYGLAFYMCHQMIQSSHFFYGLQFPLCARQVGMHLGFLIGLFSLYVTGDYLYKRTSPSVLLFLVPLGIDALTQLAGLRESNFYLRAATGLIFGLGMAYVFNSALRNDLSRLSPSRHTLLISLVLLIPAFFLMLPFIAGTYNPLGWIFFWAISLSIPLLGLYIVMAVARYAHPFLKKISENLDKMTGTSNL